LGVKQTYYIKLWLIKVTSFNFRTSLHMRTGLTVCEAELDYNQKEEAEHQHPLGLHFGTGVLACVAKLEPPGALWHALSVSRARTQSAAAPERLLAEHHSVRRFSLFY
jgi:hypothetical protein